MDSPVVETEQNPHIEVIDIIRQVWRRFDRGYFLKVSAAFATVMFLSFILLSVLVNAFSSLMVLMPVASSYLRLGIFLFLGLLPLSILLPFVWNVALLGLKQVRGEPLSFLAVFAEIRFPILLLSASLLFLGFFMILQIPLVALETDPMLDWNVIAQSFLSLETFSTHSWALIVVWTGMAFVIMVFYVRLSFYGLLILEGIALTPGMSLMKSYSLTRPHVRQLIVIEIGMILLASLPGRWEHVLPAAYSLPLSLGYMLLYVSIYVLMGGVLYHAIFDSK